MKEKFTTIFEKGSEDELISFFKSLDATQKKELVPSIKKLTKEYTAYGAIGGNSYGYIKGKDYHRDLLQMAAFVCFGFADYEKSHFSVWMLAREKLSKVINWYVPEWFSQFVNKLAGAEYIPVYLDYNWVMELTERGILKPSRELIARLFTDIIFEHDKQRNWIYSPQNLLLRPVTLEEHFWFVFDVETNMHFADRFLHFGAEKSKERIGWYPAILLFVNEGRIDRMRLLREALLASNKNFNKVLSGWFAQLFVELNPGIGEILSVQKELFSVLGAVHSKPVNTALSAIKKIVNEKEFDVNGFFDAVPGLLSSETKATVSATLMILEKIAKRHKHETKKIGLLACHTLIHADDELQSRAARIIANSFSSANEAIAQELESYRGTLMSSGLQLLGHLLMTDTSTENAAGVTVGYHEKQTGPEAIPPVETLDDLVFLASQVFDNNQPWHIAVFPAELLKWHAVIRGENIARFEPSLQRALKLTRDNLNAQQGMLDHMLALFFIDVCIYWVREYPADAGVLNDLFEKFDALPHAKGKWMNIGTTTSYLAGWTDYLKLSFYNGHKEMLIVILEKIKTKNYYPLLSTPTHEPGWIDPLVLATRLATYQRRSQPPYDIDLQIAVSRCRLHNVNEAIRFVNENLVNEYKNLLLFLFDDHKQPKQPFNIPTAWMMASLAKKEKKSYSAFGSFPWYKKGWANYTGQLKWACGEQDYTFQRYDVDLRKYVDAKGRRKMLRVIKDDSVKDESGLKKFFQKIAGRDEPVLTALCEWMVLKTQWLSVQHNDIQRILLLAPNNPEPMLADTINQCMSDPTFGSETNKKFVIATLQLLHEIWDEYGEIGHLFIAVCMICSDKTASNIAAEIWINAVNNGKINGGMIGDIIGTIQGVEFAPLKRFTDLALQQLFRISPAHNKALLLMIENIVQRLPDEPVNNLKKLLEIYAELLVQTDSKLTADAIIRKLELWKRSPSVTKVIEKILNPAIPGQS